MAPAVFQILIAWPTSHSTDTDRWISPSVATAGQMSPGTLYGSIKQMLEDGLIEKWAEPATTRRSTPADA